MNTTGEDGRIHHCTDDADQSAGHDWLRNLLIRARDEAMRNSENNVVGILYRAHDEEGFHWTGVGNYPEHFLDMFDTFVRVTVAIADEAGNTPEEVRGMLHRVIDGKCPRCGQSMEDGEPHQH